MTIPYRAVQNAVRTDRVTATPLDPRISRIAQEIQAQISEANDWSPTAGHSLCTMSNRPVPVPVFNQSGPEFTIHDPEAYALLPELAR